MTPPFPPRRALAAALLAALGLAAAAPARAELPNEVRIYDDGLNDAGEWSLELHVNRTTKGRRQAEDAGELATTRGLRVTPELSYGLGADLEVGLLLPMLFDAAGNSYFGGQQLQLKWLPLRPPATGGFFLGANWELTTLDRRFDAARNGLEFRPIFGYRDPQWLLSANLLLSYRLTREHRAGGLDFSPALKAAKTLAPGLAGGFEYYADLGKLAHLEAAAERNHTLYAVFDVESEPWSLNFGIGRGLNSATDPWMVKAILEFPIGR